MIQKAFTFLLMAGACWLWLHFGSAQLQWGSLPNGQWQVRTLTQLTFAERPDKTLISMVQKQLMQVLARFIPATEGHPAPAAVDSIAQQGPLLRAKG